MPKVMLSGRVEDGLQRWVTAYAIERGVSRTAVLEWALREARALAKAGVPDLLEAGSADGRSASVGRVRGAGSRATSSPGAPAASSRPAAGAPASGSSAELAALAARDVHESAVPGWEGRKAANRATEPGAGHPAPPASVADVVTGTGPRSTARAVPEAVRARQERLNKAKGMR